MNKRFTLTAVVAASAIFLAACGGDDETAPPASGSGGTPGPVPTATPFAALPEPVIVSGAGTGGAPAPGREVTYVVQGGDTLSAIAERFDSTVDAISEANDLDGPDLAIGQELRIPGATVEAPPAATATPAPSGGEPGGGQTGGTGTGEGEFETYVVADGDTAYGIALQFDVTLAELAAANDMTEEEIADLSIGQELRIPRS